MKPHLDTLRTAGLTILVLLLAHKLAHAATPAELGRYEYEAHCASCHGLSAEGDGPLRPFLVQPPADLTRLSQRYGGRFPAGHIADLIDGRSTATASVHGTRDMPVWGAVYLRESREQTRGTPFPAEWSVRGRITALVEYLRTLQGPLEKSGSDPPQ